MKNATSNSDLKTVSRTIQKDGKTYLVQGSPCTWNPSTDLVFSCWEELGSILGAPYSTLTRINGATHGKLGTERGDHRYASLPAGSKARVDAQQMVAAENAQRALDLIFEAFPEMVGRQQAHRDFLGAYEMRFSLQEGEVL